MSLVPSLLQAIVSIDGEALVMHAGDKPYVVAPSGQVELASKGLTLDAVNGIVSQLLPPDIFNALDEFGAIQHELAAQPGFPGESFTVVAARGGDDVWVEVRRRKIPDDDRLPDDLFGAPPAGAVAAPAPVAAQTPVRDAAAEIPLAAAPVASAADDDDLSLSLPDAGQLFGATSSISSGQASTPAPAPVAPPTIARVVPPPPKTAAPAPPPPKQAPVAPPVIVAPAAAAPVAAPPVVAPLLAPPPAPLGMVAPPPLVMVPPIAAAPMPPPPIAPPPAFTPQPESAFRVFAPPLAPVLPLARSPIRTDTPAPIMSSGVSGLDRLVRMAAARGASTLYLSSNARPSIRVDGEIQMLEGEPSHGPNDVESLLVTMMPERNHEALRIGQATEWIADLEGVGRVRCLSFRDHRGPGGIFRMMPVRAVSTEQLGLTREVQSLAIEPEGIVLITGPRLSGKRTMISAFVDLMNRTRRDHVITIENEINVVHDRGTSFISQREVRGSYEEVEHVARAALREDPDVLVIESMRTAPLINVALEAAASGQLVIGGFPAHDTTAAIDRIINLYPPEYRRQVQLAMAENLRGVVAQVLVRKNGGGRLAAREILLNNPAVAGIIAEGRTSQIPIAIEGGRRQGMQPLNDALAGLVQSGSVDLREAYMRAADRGGFLALLKRLGMDTALVERVG